MKCKASATQEAIHINEIGEPPSSAPQSNFVRADSFAKCSGLIAMDTLIGEKYTYIRRPLQKSQNSARHEVC